MITAVFAVVDSLEDGLKSTFNMLDARCSSFKNGHGRLTKNTPGGSTSNAGR